MVSGGFAQKVVVPELAVVKLPDAVSFEAGASTLINYGTTLHALVDRAALRAGETLLVLGAAGGVGIAAVELGALLGAGVIAAASNDAKVEFCKERGAVLGINYTREDLKKQAKALSGGAGVDVVYDPVGGAYAEPALRALAWQGRYLVIGFAAGDIPKIPLNLVLLTGGAIVGVFWGSFAMRDPAKIRENAATLFGWIAEGRLRPHIDGTFPLSAATEVLSRIERREVKGKMLLVP
jgi:NADPH2:quinone reductase